MCSFEKDIVDENKLKRRDIRIRTESIPNQIDKDNNQLEWSNSAIYAQTQQKSEFKYYRWILCYLLSNFGASFGVIITATAITLA